MQYSRPLFTMLMSGGLCGLMVAVAPAWETDGTPICNADNDQDSPQIVSLGGGTTIMTWVDRRPFPDIYAQMVGPDGDAAWTSDGVPVCAATNAQYTPQIGADGSGGAVLTWRDNRAGNADVYAQRIDASGAPLWSIDGVALTTAAGAQQEPQIAADGTGGCIVVWTDDRGALADIYAGRVDGAGNVLWVTDGVAVCTADGIQQHCQIVTDGEGGAIIVWVDYRSGGDIYAQRLGPDGVPLWTANGVAVCSVSGFQYTPQLVADGNGGAIVTWQDHRTWYDIFAQRVDQDGTMLWEDGGVAVCAADEWQGFPAIADCGRDGAIIAWQDNRNGGWEVYAQRVDSLGVPRWTTDGVLACEAGGEELDVAVCSDGAKGGVLAWRDSRNVQMNVYATRIDSLGEHRWSVDGEPVCVADGNQDEVQIATDDDGGGIVVWNDARGADDDIYAGRMSDSNVPVMPPDHGMVVVPAATTILRSSPNPLNPVTTISYVLSADAHVQLVIHDVNGREVIRLEDRPRSSGVHTVIWDGRDDLGRVLNSGVYVCRLRAGGDTVSTKLTVAR